MGVHQRDRLQHVAQVLAHLAALGVQDVPQAQHVAVRRLPGDQSADGHQGVEPATGLIDGLTDEVRRVGGLELLDVGLRVAELGERHRSGVVPAVDDLGHPVRLLLALRALERDVVDERPVRVHRVEVLAGERRQFRA